MKRKAIVRIHPLERFNVRFNRKRCKGPGNVYFRNQSHFYQCPICSRKTLIRFRQLDAIHPSPSQFPKELRSIFAQIELSAHDAIFDFFCRGCGRPVRLLYWTQERRMGGLYDSYVKRVLEHA